MKSEKIISFGLVLGAIAGIIYFFTRKKTSAISASLAQNAIEHYQLWEKGKIKEGDPKTINLLNDYWATVGWANRSQADKIKNPWSAAFISHMAKLSGSTDFKFSPSHSTYTVQSIINRATGKGSYFGYKSEEVPLEVGDIVVKPRAGSNANYNSTGNYSSHGDIVVSIKNGEAIMIGGNVSDSVSATKVKLDAQNKISPSEIAKNKYFAVIKFK